MTTFFVMEEFLAALCCEKTCDERVIWRLAVVLGVMRGTS